ncbi:MAG: cupin [Rubrivivax sp.]|nr:MAG: cupin [Rubrivivax sp.]
MDAKQDLSQRAVVDSNAVGWVDSPCEGVQRRRMESSEDGSGRVSAVVRYDAGSQFHAHSHEHGEEILVLSGIFCDEHGEYPEGTYVRNPPGFRHAPFSKVGCTIFVKLQQMSAHDRHRVVTDTHKANWFDGQVKGLSVLPLHHHGEEGVALVHWQPGTRFHRHVHPGGEEIFVIEGTFEDDLGSYPKGTWLRNPAGSVHQPFSRNGCLIYVKTGHLCSVVHS